MRCDERIDRWTTNKRPIIASHDNVNDKENDNRPKHTDFFLIVSTVSEPSAFILFYVILCVRMSVSSTFFIDFYTEWLGCLFFFCLADLAAVVQF